MAPAPHYTTTAGKYALRQKVYVNNSKRTTERRAEPRLLCRKTSRGTAEGLLRETCDLSHRTQITILLFYINSKTIN